VVDFMTGIQQEDIDITKFIRKNNKKTILIVNKNDIKAKNYYIDDFYKLGMGDPFPLSAEQGNNVFELLNKIASLSNDKEIDEKVPLKENEIINIAIIGKPNVGKSSLLNALLNDERIIVDNNPGTTRDSIEVLLEYDDYHLNFVDTSGLRKKRNVKEKVEYFGNKRAINSIKKADIVLLVLDATRYISMQDKRLAERIIEENKACIVVLNKYDLILQDKEIDKDFLIKTCKYELRFLKDSQILTTIAVGNKRDVSSIIKAILETYHEYNKKISTPELNKFLQKTVILKPPKIIEGKRLKFYYITQTDVKPPTFKVFVNQPNLLYNSYQRYMKNQFMSYFNIKGIPVVFHYLKKV
ncbi:MAG: ribosome biogenesis GTPase Der, partial [Atribacterota bacterium]|nr:ribosome biogenesis GTPase Der [Atribacterota bacterium]